MQEVLEQEKKGKGTSHANIKSLLRELAYPASSFCVPGHLTW